MKRGETWVSAVLYIALGTIVIALLLAAGNPLIQKLRDRNVIEQSREVVIGLNNAIRTVTREGTGSQRSVIIDIGRGNLVIDETVNTVVWSMESKNIFTEVDVPIKEGDLTITTKSTAKQGRYDIVLALDFTGKSDLLMVGDGNLAGRHNLIVKNKGVNIAGNIEIEINDVV